MVRKMKMSQKTIFILFLLLNILIGYFAAVYVSLFFLFHTSWGIQESTWLSFSISLSLAALFSIFKYHLFTKKMITFSCAHLALCTSLLLFLFFFTESDDSWQVCGDQIILERESPSQKYIATVHFRDCGATTNFSTAVRIKNSVASEKNESDIFVIDGEVPLNLVWVDETNLQVENSITEKFYLQKKSWGPITISYK